MKGLFFSLVLLNRLAESVYKNVLCDKVLPLPGSILKVALLMNPVDSACHTGIYVGNNRIVEMTNDGGAGIIQEVTPRHFLSYSLYRTGVFIYVACGRKDGKYYPLADPETAERALKAVGDRTKYNILLDNCHLFTEYCIAGSCDSPIGTLKGIEKALVKKHRLAEASGGGHRHSPVRWMSTGVSLNDSFPDR